MDQILEPSRLVSLWLVPTGALHNELAEQIRRLARRYRAPVFGPHVTLLGGVGPETEAVLSRCEALARRLSPFEIHLTRTAAQGEYYRCLFVEVEPTPALLDAHASACETFDRRGESPFDAHLSLMYGTLPAAVKQALLSETKEEWSLSFTANSLYVVSTEGHPDAWHAVRQIPFNP